jgi:hypothetical protein
MACGCDQLALKLIERGGDVEEQPTLWRAGVDIAGQHPERLLLLLEVVSGLDDLFEGSRQPGKPPDYERVAGAHVFECGCEFRAVTMYAGRLLDIEALAPSLFQGVDLQLGILVQGRDPRVANEHICS